jgi:hypothetical protein
MYSWWQELYSISRQETTVFRRLLSTIVCLLTARMAWFSNVFFFKELHSTCASGIFCQVVISA